MAHNRACLRSVLSLVFKAWRRGDQLLGDQRGHEGTVEVSVGMAIESSRVSVYV